MIQPTQSPHTRANCALKRKKTTKSKRDEIKNINRMMLSPFSQRRRSCPPSRNNFVRTEEQN